MLLQAVQQQGHAANFAFSGWLGLLVVAIGIAGAVAFLLAYSDRLRLKNTIESLRTTVDAYKEEIAVHKAENASLTGKVGECQGAIKVLTEAVTQSAKVEMLAHSTEAQHRAILMKLEELGSSFATVAARVEASAEAP